MFIRTVDTDSPRTIYVCNALVRDIIAANDPARMRLINCGVKTFTRQGNEGGKASAAANAGAGADADDDAIDVDDAAGAENEDAIIADTENGAGKKGKDLVFRFVYEGVQAVLPFVDPASILVAGVKELRRMLEIYYPSITDFNGSTFAAQMDFASECLVLNY